MKGNTIDSLKSKFTYGKVKQKDFPKRRKVVLLYLLFVNFLPKWLSHRITLCFAFKIKKKNKKKIIQIIYINSPFSNPDQKHFIRPNWFFICISLMWAFTPRLHFIPEKYYCWRNETAKFRQGQMYLVKPSEELEKLRAS